MHWFLKNNCLTGHSLIRFGVFIPWKRASYWQSIRSVGCIKLCHTLSGLNMDSKIMPSVPIAVIQMLASHSKENNLKLCTDLIKDAASRKAKMIFLPECFDYIGRNDEETTSLAETLDGPLIQAYQRLAKQYKIYLSLGGCHIKVPGDALNRIHKCHVVINDEGRIECSYNAIHFSSPAIKGERSVYFIPGNEIAPPVDSPVGKVGLGLYSDVQYPEMSLHLRGMGAELLAFPSAFACPPSQIYWETLLRSRAIECQCYVVVAAQSGKHSTLTSYGHSLVIDPWGQIMASCADERTAMLFVNIDPSLVRGTRNRIPILDHQRRDIFPLVTNLGQAAAIENGVYKIDDNIVHEDFVFYRSAFTFACIIPVPVVSGHAIVCPIEVTSRLKDLSREQVADLFTCVQKIGAALQKHYGAPALTVSVQDGIDTGRVGEHLQVHILPRKAGDFPKVDDIYSKLEQMRKGEEVIQRSHEDMMEEASQLRKLFY